MSDIPGVDQFFFFIAFTVPRMMAALSISPFFGPQFIGGIARQVVIMSLSLTAAPIVWNLGAELPEGSSWSFFVLDQAVDLNHAATKLAKGLTILEPHLKIF